MIEQKIAVSTCFMRFVSVICIVCVCVCTYWMAYKMHWSCLQSRPKKLKATIVENGVMEGVGWEVEVGSVSRGSGKLVSGPQACITSAPTYRWKPFCSGWYRKAWLLERSLPRRGVWLTAEEAWLLVVALLETSGGPPQWEKPLAMPNILW